MTIQDTLAGPDAIAQASRDIHERCKAEIDILWDGGKSHGDGLMHTVKIWNGLGSVQYYIQYRDLVERGEAYRQFIDKLAEIVRRQLTVEA